jgi:glycine/D-amino acid oxidase-like deaminating enzyme
MDLHSGLPYWPLLHGIVASYPSLTHNLDCEVAVIGGGITGAVIGWHLSEEGYEVKLFDRRHVGMGSTAASTALLQYELDTSLIDLIRIRGERTAVRSYLLCENAIKDIGDLCNHLHVNEFYDNTGSFQFATYKKDCVELKREFEARKRIGIQVNWLDENSVKRSYKFEKPGGILSETGASLDAYGLVHALLQDGIKKNLEVFDHTEIDGVQFRDHHVILSTTEGKKIRAAKLVIAGGYESERYLPKKVQQLYSTYAIISEPLGNSEFWNNNSLIWETARPYLYMRTTNDGRIAVGGKDTPGSDPGKRYRNLPVKKKQLEEAFKKLYPGIPFKTDFAWAGSFASTRDGLPYIGSVAKRPHTFFVLGLGGNGIPFSMVATRLVSNWLKKKNHDDLSLFSFDR